MRRRYRSLSSIAKSRLYGLGAIVLIGALWLLTQRLLLAGGLAVAVAALTWTAVRRPERLARRASVLCVLAATGAALPMDVWLLHTGRPGAGAGEIVWETLSVAPVRDGRVEVLSGGCVAPSWNPPRYALWVSY